MVPWLVVWLMIGGVTVSCLTEASWDAPRGRGTTKAVVRGDGGNVAGCERGVFGASDVGEGIGGSGGDSLANARGVSDMLPRPSYSSSRGALAGS